MADKRKIYTMEQLVKLISKNIEGIKLPLILAGNNFESLNSKTESELRKMLCGYVVLDKIETSKIFDLDLSELKTILTKLGFDEKDFAGKSRREIEDLFITAIGDTSLLSREIKKEDTVKTEEDVKSTKKVLSDKQLEELLFEEDVTRLRARIVLLGITTKESQGKTLQEIRVMIKDKITFSDEQIINILNGDNKQLRKIVSAISTENDCEHRFEYEEEFIEIIGIDRVMEAMAKVCIQDEKHNTSRRMKFLSSLDNCRRARGKEIYESEEFQSLEDNVERKDFIRKLSAYENEDLQSHINNLTSGYGV